MARKKTKFAYQITFNTPKGIRKQIIGAFTKQEAINKHKKQFRLRRLRPHTLVIRTGKWVE